jgi:hypothetical protein
MVVINFTNSTKFETNLLKKLIFPKNDWVYFLDLGYEKVWISSTLLGSIFTPLVDTMCPNNFPSFMQNNNFWGFKERPNFLHFKNTLLK